MSANAKPVPPVYEKAMKRLCGNKSRSTQKTLMDNATMKTQFVSGNSTRNDNSIFENKENLRDQKIKPFMRELKQNVNRTTRQDQKHGALSVIAETRDVQTILDESYNKYETKGLDAINDKSVIALKQRIDRLIVKEKAAKNVKPVLVNKDFIANKKIQEICADIYVQKGLNKRPKLNKSFGL